MDITNTSPLPPPIATAHAPTASRDELASAAQAFEATFIRQMLEYAGFAEALAGDGGAAPDAFASFALDAIAEDMAASGGFGLAEQFYRQLSVHTETDSRGQKL